VQVGRLKRLATIQYFQLLLLQAVVVVEWELLRVVLVALAVVEPTMSLVLGLVKEQLVKATMVV
jgi:hypothetical protein